MNTLDQLRVYDAQLTDLLSITPDSWFFDYDSVPPQWRPSSRLRQWAERVLLDVRDLDRRLADGGMRE